MNDVQHSYLCDLLKQTRDALRENSEVNRVLALSNLINAGVLSKEDAMKDPCYYNYINKLKRESKIDAKVIKF